MNTTESLLNERTKDVGGQVANAAQQAAAPDQSLRDCVERAVSNYFQHLEGQDVSDVYEMVLAEVEAPMLEVVMKYTRHNQTKAANVLGLNRGTLRKKLKQYGLL
ncbi:MAG: Fis family transcriptional regulator [Lentisphaeria bacterium]|jgi:Fis family transcriptional regulator